jgi:DNA-binding NarL/FixJ family response regulator
MTTSILLVDDHKMMRDGLRSLLEKHAELQVVGEAEDGRSAVRMVRKRHVDIVLMDVAMPEVGSAHGPQAPRRHRVDGRCDAGPQRHRSDAADQGAISRG